MTKAFLEMNVNFLEAKFVMMVSTMTEVGIQLMSPLSSFFVN